MNSRLVRIVLPIALLAVFILIMTSDWILKRPLTGDDDMQLLIDTLRADLVASDWSQATVDWEHLHAAWETVAARVQFSAEREELRGITVSLARLQGAILAESTAGALMELGEAEQRWRDLAR